MLAEPVSHDGDHGGPASGLEEAVEHPERHVVPDAVDVQPLAQRAEHKHLRANASTIT